MSEEKKELKKELKKNECCEGKQKLSIEELEKVTGGLKLDPERLRKKVEEVYPV